MYEIFIDTSISSAHRLRDYPGPCRNLHGHNWLIKVILRSRELNRMGMGIDFKVLREALDEVCREIDHVDLNDLEYFQRYNPTAENLARYIYDELSAGLDTDRVQVYKVEVRETAESGAVYWREEA